MALQQIDVDTVYPNNERGAPQRTASIITNDNMVEVEQRLLALEDSGPVVDQRFDSLDDQVASLSAGLEANSEAIAAESSDRQEQGQVLLSRLSQLEGRSVLINGNFGVFQDGTSGTLQQQEAYTVDMWNCACLGAGAVCNWGVGRPLIGEIEGAKYFLGFNVVAGATAAWIGQKIEGVETLANGKATLSFWMRSGVAGKNVGLRLVQNFGSGGSSAVTVEGEVVTLGVGFRKYTVTFDVPSISGKILGTTTDYLYLVFDLNGAGYGGQIAGQTGLFELAQVKLERGETATRFEFLDDEQVLAICQKHFEKSYDRGVKPGQTNAETGQEIIFLYGGPTGSYATGKSVPFKVTKRIPPVVTNYSTITGATAKARSFAPNQDVDITVNNVGVSSAFVTILIPTTTNNINLRWQWKADARIY